VKLASADYIDLRMHEPAMRHLIDAYLRGETCTKIIARDDVLLARLIVECGADAAKILSDAVALATTC
jgi:type I restriction enzyme R subunit